MAIERRESDFGHLGHWSLRTAKAARSKEFNMAFDALAALRAAGNPVDQLSEGQREVFASLTEDEVEVLNSIKRRLDAVEDDVDVTAHDVKVF